MHYKLQNELQQLVSRAGQKPHSLVEEDLLLFFKNLNLKDVLIAISMLSARIFNAKEPQVFERSALCHPEGEGFITQHQLAYLANIAIVSGASDFAIIPITGGGDPVFFTLGGLYANGLPDPLLLEKDGGKSSKHMLSFLVRADFEQLAFQFHFGQQMARSIELFEHLSKVVPSSKINSLNKVLVKISGLSIREYFCVACAFYKNSSRRPSFHLSSLAQSEVARQTRFLNIAQLKKFLTLKCANYDKFRKEDMRLNESLHPKYTKTRFNTLLTYPLIEFSDSKTPSQYCIPSLPLYVKSAFQGLYWVFHRYYESLGMHLEFRKYFGALFEEYVGRLLRGAFGEAKVSPEIRYADSRRFFDWIVTLEGKTYFFECKAYQFALPRHQTGAIEEVLHHEIKKVAEAVVQVYKRTKEIGKHPELERFRGKKVVPIIVFYDMPFGSISPDNPWLKDAIKKKELELNLSGLSSFTYHTLDIEDLEFFEGAADCVDLEDLILQSQGESGSIGKVVREITGEAPYSKLLHEVSEKKVQQCLDEEEDTAS